MGWWTVGECSVYCWGAFTEARYWAPFSLQIPNPTRQPWHSTPHKRLRQLWTSYICAPTHTHTHTHTLKRNRQTHVIECQCWNRMHMFSPLFCSVSFCWSLLLFLQNNCMSRLREPVSSPMMTGVLLTWALRYSSTCLFVCVSLPFHSLNPPELARWQFVEYKTW